MADVMVIRAQKFINTYNYAGIPKVEENGRTSWTVMFALTRALQFELGITALSDSFGPTTLATLQSKMPNIDGATPGAGRINKIIQSALYCKGYDGGEIDGIYNQRVKDAVRKLKLDMGVQLAFPGDGVTPKVFKALLTMDPYVLLPGGDSAVRSAQCANRRPGPDPWSRRSGRASGQGKPRKRISDDSGPLQRNRSRRPALWGRTHRPLPGV